MNKPFDLDSRQHTYSKKKWWESSQGEESTYRGRVSYCHGLVGKEKKMKIRWWNIIDSVWFAKQLLQTNYVPSSVWMKRLKILFEF